MNAKVLVVDDHPNYRRLLLSAARSRGFSVLEPCSTAVQAIQSCNVERPEIVVLDLHLPGDLDGFSLCRLLQDINGHARIVVCSSFAESDLVERAFASGAHRCLRKPFRLEEAQRIFEHLAAEFEAVVRA